jgi:hypothetical protein
MISGAMAQGDPCIWPPLTRSPIGRPRNNEVLQSGKMLKDVLAVISQDVDPVDKVGSGSGLATREGAPHTGYIGLIERFDAGQLLPVREGESST